MTIQEKATAARDLANELYKGPCLRAVPGCLETERLRPLKGHDAMSNRSFGQYDPARLCNDCLAYWYAEMAAQTLERNARFAAEDIYSAARADAQAAVNATYDAAREDAATSARRPK